MKKISLRFPKSLLGKVDEVVEKSSIQTRSRALQNAVEEYVTHKLKELGDEVYERNRKDYNQTS